MKRQARLRVNPKDGEGPSGGYATQSTRQPRYYDRNPDAQVAYDRFYAEGVTGNENWAEFIDHDIQRLEGIISAGGLPARQAEDYCRWHLNIILPLLPGYIDTAMFQYCMADTY